MAFVPATVVRLCSVPIDITQKNQIRFATAAAQSAYFASKTTHVYTDFTYQRKDNTIRIPAHIDSLWDSNYVMYDNANFTNKWFYAFIEKMEYMNDNVTLVTIKTDVFQTWFLDCTLKDSFVVREHISTTLDTAGYNTVPEGLELGDIVPNGAPTQAGLDDMDIIVASTITDEGMDAIGLLFNNVYSAVAFYGSTDAASINSFITATTQPGIISIFMMPHAFTQRTSALTLMYSATNNISVTGPAIPTSIDGYTPKNKKLLAYPYNFLYVHNNAGSSAVFKYELFTGTPTFNIYGNVGPNAVFKLVPTNIDNVGSGLTDYDQGLTLGGFPICPWSDDVYKTWAAQNAAGQALGVVGAGIAIATGAATGNPLGIVSGVMGVANILADRSARAAQPPQSRGAINSAGANATIEKNDFFFCKKSIREEYARIIDEYFEMYGYKINRVKTPSIASRTYWNYLQTADVNMTGNVPGPDMSELKSLFNTGITLWHDAANVGNYNLNNH